MFNNSSDSPNKNDNDDGYTSAASVAVQCLLYSLLFVFGIVLNSAIIWLVYKKRSLRTITNMWVVSLCASQLLTCLFSLPFVVVATAAHGWLLGDGFCQAYGFLTVIFRTVSILSVAGIAMDRYHVISRPFSKRMRRGTAKKLIVFCWWSSMISCIFPLTGIGGYRYSENGHICGISWVRGGSALIYSVFYVTSVYITTAIATFWSYALIYKVTKSQAMKHKKSTVKRSLSNTAHQQVNQQHQNNNHNNSSSRNNVNSVEEQRATTPPLRRNLTSFFSSRYNLFAPSSGHATMDSKATQTIVLVLTVYVLAWLPYFIHALYLAFRRFSMYRQVTVTSQWLEFTVTWLSMSTCVWDPLLYGAFTQNFKAHFINLFRFGSESSYERSRTFLTQAVQSSQSATLASRHATTVKQSQGARPWQNKLRASIKRTTSLICEKERIVTFPTTINLRSSLDLNRSFHDLDSLQRTAPDEPRRTSLTAAHNASFVMDDVGGGDHVTVTSQSLHCDAGTLPLPTHHKREFMDRIKVQRMYGGDGDKRTGVNTVSTLSRINTEEEEVIPPTVRRKVLPLSPRRLSDIESVALARNEIRSWTISSSSSRKRGSLNGAKEELRRGSRSMAPRTFTEI